MTAPPLKKPVATCKAKRRYPDEYSARAAAMIHIEDGWSDVPALGVYKCNLCLGWHLTKSTSDTFITGDDPGV